jgi:hypothetical protein
VPNATDAIVTGCNRRDAFLAALARHFGAFEFTAACMNSMNARNLLGVWARFA